MDYEGRIIKIPGWLFPLLVAASGWLSPLVLILNVILEVLRRMTRWL